MGGRTSTETYRVQGRSCHGIVENRSTAASEHFGNFFIFSDWIIGQSEKIKSCQIFHLRFLKTTLQQISREPVGVFGRSHLHVEKIFRKLCAPGNQAVNLFAEPALN